ncbi:MAG: tetratricopeptide repeat protein [Planctomycetes bacterium]|nr:tetratricopeptide repeat protein [Planctomycetota bacterium]
MKKLFAVCVLILASPLLHAATGVDYFLNDWEKAKKLARKESKPLYVHFTTEGCGWCKKIEKDVYNNKKGKQALKAFVPVSLDCTVRNRKGKELENAKKYRKLMKKWGGGGYPFLVQVTADGIVFNSWAGYLPVDPFVKKLETGQKKLQSFKTFQKKTKTADTDSYEFNVQAMNIYMGVQQHKKALHAAEKVLELDPDNKRGNGAKAAMIRFQTLQKSGKRDELSEALNQVQNFDPKNKDGFWERAVTSYVMSLLQNARSTPPAQLKKQVVEATDKMEKLTEADVKLKEPQKDHYFLGILYAQQGKREKALKTLQKAISFNPDSREGKYIKQIIQQIKKEK